MLSTLSLQFIAQCFAAEEGDNKAITLFETLSVSFVSFFLVPTLRCFGKVSGECFGVLSFLDIASADRFVSAFEELEETVHSLLVTLEEVVVVWELTDGENTDFAVAIAD